MRPTSCLRCDACTAAATADSESGALPEGWRFLRMEGHALLLCAACAPPDGRALALTPELCTRLAERGIRLSICASLWGVSPGAPVVRGGEKYVSLRNSLTKT
jgi:hypothetical protein